LVRQARSIPRAANSAPLASSPLSPAAIRRANVGVRRKFVQLTREESAMHDLPNAKVLNMASVRGMLANVSVLVVSAWCIVSTAYAKDDLTSPQYAQCIDKSGGNTSNMIECNAVELKQQDDSLNKFYRALLAKLTPQRRQQLVKAQRAWVSFRDANCGFYLDPDGGSAARLSASSCILTTTAERAKEIKDLLESEKAGQ
jgi:uncharacterized protein YecT (DUF1311 family)